MQRTAIAILLLATLACGGQDSGSAPASGGAGTGETGSGAMPTSGDVEKALEGAVDPSVQSCLDLVREQKYAQAVPACTRAAKADPDNPEVASALQSAREQAASAQMPEATGAAREAGEAALEKATEGLPSGLPVEKPKEGLPGGLPE
jgi:hypothetical protein